MQSCDILYLQNSTNFAESEKPMSISKFPALFPSLNGVSYPCFWLPRDEEKNIWMNDAAQQITANQTQAVWHLLRTVLHNPAAVTQVLPLVNHKTAYALSIIPMPEGVLATASTEVTPPFATLGSQLREPVSDIFAVLPILAKRLEDEDLEYMESVQEKCYTLLRLTKNLETMHNLASRPLATHVVDLAALVRSIASSSASLCKQLNIPIHTDVAPHTVPVKANLHMLESAILNVLRNSLQFTRDGNAITLRLREKAGRAILMIEDHGIGIKDEYIENVFSPYFSTDPYGDSDLAPGMGLGLAVAHQVMQSYGGAITAQSSFGKGTRISMSLPIAPVKSADDLLSSDATDYIVDRFSPLYLQLAGYCRRPSL